MKHDLVIQIQMSIIYLAEACSTSTGRAELINYYSLNYTFDDTVKFP